MRFQKMRSSIVLKLLRPSTKCVLIRVYYSVFLWIPPVLVIYPEIKATEVTIFTFKNLISVAFIFQDNETKLG